MKKIVSLLLLISFLGLTTPGFSQCAMCKRIAETNVEDNQNNVGKGLNKGILYLLSLPYLIGGIGLFAWYSGKRKKRILQESHNNNLEV